MKTVKKTHNKYSLKYNKVKQSVRYGQYGIKTITFGKLTENQYKSIRRFISQYLKKNGSDNKEIKIWSVINFNLSLTKLSSESRMGKGKGSVYMEANFLKPGVMIFEFDGVTQQKATKLFSFLKKKLPFKISLVKKLLK